MAEDTKLPVADQQEIATVAKDITYLAFQGILRSRDTTLETRGGAKSYAIYDDIERDCHAYGVLQKRKLAVVARPWQVDPASKSKADVMAADMVRAQLSAMGTPAEDNPGDQVVMASNFDLVCYNLLDSILKGFAVGEIMWDIDGKEIVAREIRPKDQRRFNFDTDYKLRLKTWGQLIPGEMVPPCKFIVHTFGAKDGSPYGNGVGSRLFWPTFFKRQDITFWLTYLDKFGSPTAVGKYPNGTPLTQQADLLSALSAISQDAGVAIPEGMIIELLEAKRSGSVTYEQFARYMDEEMTFAVLGEAPTTKGGGGAQQTAALAREEVRLELVQADADLLSATLNATLSPWLTAYNVPGARAPKIWRQVQEAEDLKARSERDANLFTIGYRPTLAEVTKTYGGEWEAVPVPADPKRPPYTASSAFAEADTAPFTPDQLAARLSVEGAQPWNAMLAQIRAIVDGAASLEDLRDQLLAAFGNLDSNALAKVMQAGFAVAELVGISDVADGK